MIALDCPVPAADIFSRAVALFSARSSSLAYEAVELAMRAKMASDRLDSVCPELLAGELARVSVLACEALQRVCDIEDTRNTARSIIAGVTL